MSEYEHWKGKMKKVSFIGVTLEDTCEWYLKEKGIVPDPEYDDDNPFEMQVYDEFYREVVIYEDDLYEIIYSEPVEEYDVYNASKNGDIIEFEVCFYNGGQGFNEAVGTALDTLEDI